LTKEIQHSQPFPPLPLLGFANAQPNLRAQATTAPSELIHPFAQGITSLQMLERAIANLSEAA
jgi:hypothetical protein